MRKVDCCTEGDLVLPCAAVGGGGWGVPGASPSRLHQPVDGRPADASRILGPLCPGCLKGQTRAWGSDEGTGCGGPGCGPGASRLSVTLCPGGSCQQRGGHRTPGKDGTEGANTPTGLSGPPAAGCGRRPRLRLQDQRRELATAPGPACCVPTLPLPPGRASNDVPPLRPARWDRPGGL